MSHTFSSAKKPTIYSQDQDNFDKKVKIEFEKRSNKALWFVSNCNSERRMRVTSLLGNHYPVVVFGGCAKIMREKFPSVTSSKIEFSHGCGRGSSCEINSYHSFKFYLSLENSNCSDYITEKFWKSLANDLIPIVLQPNRKYY